jgi:hypothetical protein
MPVENINVFGKFWKIRVERFLPGIKAQWEEDGGSVLLGDNRGGWAPVLRPIRFQYVQIRISARVPCIYVHSWPCACSVPICAKSDLEPCLPGLTTARVCVGNVFLVTSYWQLNTEIFNRLHASDTVSICQLQNTVSIFHYHMVRHPRCVL